ncbi:MAG: LytR C-terminal domain-containing protein [Desulfobacteraceae bacterium]|nr:LytR C-terminal domain-containing protein [Desulfobacteraceae bacterium]
MTKESYLLHGLIFFCSFCMSCTGCSNRDKINADGKFNFLKSLVHVGMDIDKASDILKAQGFKVGAKHTPTKDKDYYVVIVPLREKIPVSATIGETLGIGAYSDNRVYAVLKANLDNKIISIE